MTAPTTRNNRVRQDVVTGVIDALPVAVAEVDSELRIRFVNRLFRESFVGARRKLVGMPLAQVAERFAEAFGRAIQGSLGGGSSVREARLAGPDGRSRDVRATFVPRHDAQGELVGVVVSAADVTEEKRRLASERILAQATEDLFATLQPEAALQTVADNAIAYLADWISIELVRDDGSFEQVAIAHRDPDRLLLAGQIRRSHPPHAAIRRVVKTGTSELADHLSDEELAARAGDPVHLELLRRMDIGASLAVPLRAHDHVFGAVELVRSRSSGRTFTPGELALVEELARRAALAIENARLFELTRRAVVAREQLLAIVCHDLRDPLGVIRGRCELLKQRIHTLGDPEGLSVEAIERATSRMESLVSALADAARVRAGRLSLDPQLCDLVALAREAADGVADLAARKDIRVSLVAAGERIMATVDPDRVAQVLSNLLGNAVKFTQPGGHVELRVSRGKNEVHLAVVDDGPGIAREDLARIFDRYWQVEPGQRRSSGLGLYIARGIVDAHRGRIWAESQVGHGTAFRIALPAGGDRLDADASGEWSLAPDTPT
ncbi:MAG TPA: PAS domain-containing sensor histidine kinase [Kofleriaceae bacterium]|nr:PAS domain-containing sensor histidine kinase [Kofleriaceae bacterium]